MRWNLEEEKNREIRNNLTRRLRRHNLVLDDQEVVSHGSHPESGMDFRVWICFVKEKGDKNGFWITLYPRSAYWTEDWIKCNPDNRAW